MVAGMEAEAAVEPTTTEVARKRRWRRRCNLRQLSDAGNPNILTSLVLAVVIRPENPSSESLLKQLLKKLLQFLRSEPEPFLNPILSLLPALLRSKCDGTACAAAKIAGAVALVSIEANERIASESEVLSGFATKIVMSEKKAVKKAMCNAVLDVSTTSFGRRRLIESSCLQYLMLGFHQLQMSMISSIGVTVMEREGDPYLVVKPCEDDLPWLLLDSIVILTNSCNTDQHKRIWTILMRAVLTYLKNIWLKVRGQLLASSLPNFSESRQCYVSSITAYNLAESIFRLSMDAPSLPCSIESEVITRHILGSQRSSFINFLSEHWESSPFLTTEKPIDVVLLHDIFGSSAHILTSEAAVPKFLSTALQKMVSCPPVALDEIDILSSLSDVRDKLGSPVTYQKDIRVVRTSSHSKSEEHYFQRSSCIGTEALRSFSMNDILECEAAYREGYTIALRGMQFRFTSIAAISQEIASLLGQPSVGANLYVTPPNSQGLACHFDDHCVFVCQLFGTKRWIVFPEPIVQMPRLYEHHEVPRDSLEKSREIVLRAGDVLYIPRGFAHEACTASGVNERNGDYGFSMHLTVAIEVEPPFQWEGFAHVALHQWSHETESNSFASGSFESLKAISVSVLHVAIRLVSDSVVVFRKACLVAASSLPPETKDWLDKNQRAIFTQLITKIHEAASFEDSLEYLQLALQRNEDPFRWLRWLEHLSHEKVSAQDNWNSTLDGIHRILSFIHQHKADAKAAFAHMKSKFCCEILFEDVKERFKTLYAMFKQARMQYMNGMLSLHC